MVDFILVVVAKAAVLAWRALVALGSEVVVVMAVVALVASKSNSVGSGSSRVVVVLVVVMFVILMVEIWGVPESLHSRSTFRKFRDSVGTIAVLTWYHRHH